jgi:2-iminobutanoate/2-iminopropanoate deaminase
MSAKTIYTLLFVLAIATSLAQAQGKQGTTPPGQTSSPQVVASKGAPAAAGPYSQAIKAGGLVFAAGQTGRDPATNKLVEGDISVQTERVLKNLSAVLEAAGTSMDRVVRTTVYLKNISDFAKMNEVYGPYFKSNPPARTTVGVAALPGDALVEIDVIAMQ